VAYLCAVCIWRDKAVVLVECIPAGRCRLRGQIEPVGVATQVPLASADNAGNVAVGRDSWQRRNGRTGDAWDGEGVQLQDVECY